MRYLDDKQVEQFHEDGFLVVEEFVPAAACDELRAHATALVEAHEPEPPEARSIFTTHEQTRRSDEYFLTSGDKVRFFYEEDDPGTVNKIGHAMHDLDPVFDRFSHTPELAAVASDIGMNEPVLLQSMYIFKAPFVGGEVTLHNDHTFLWTEPQSVTGFWFALEDATLENGCMWALPGGHRIAPKRRFRRATAEDGGGTTFDELDQTPYPQEGEVPLEAPKGTLVVLHGLLPHRSGPNTSPRSRHAYTIHAVERGAEYPEWNWLQRPDLPLRGFQ
jgi:phytanoyl-CoA hydroxylase